MKKKTKNKISDWFVLWQYLHLQTTLKNNLEIKVNIAFAVTLD